MNSKHPTRVADADPAQVGSRSRSERRAEQIRLAKARSMKRAVGTFARIAQKLTDQAGAVSAAAGAGKPPVVRDRKTRKPAIGVVGKPALG